jgi:hypothetical protein
MTYVLVLGAPQEGLAGRDLAVAWGIRTQAPPAVDTTLAGASAVAPAVPTARSAEPAQEVQTPATEGPAAPPLLGDPLDADTTL